MRTCNNCHKICDDSNTICISCKSNTLPYQLTINDIILFGDEDNIYSDPLYIIDVTAIFSESTIKISGKHKYTDDKIYNSLIDLDKYTEKFYIPRIVDKFQSNRIYRPSIKLRCTSGDKEPTISICFKNEDERERVKIFLSEIDNWRIIKEANISQCHENVFAVDINKSLSFSLVRYSNQDETYSECDFLINENNLVCKFYSFANRNKFIVKKYQIESIKILNIKDGLRRIFIDDFTLFLNEEKVLQLKSYCNNVDIIVMEKGLENENIVKQIRATLNETANNIGLNFLKLDKSQVLKSYNHYILLDADYSFNSLDLETDTYFTYDLEEFEFQFNEYVNVLKTDYNIDIKYCNEVAWLLLKDTAVTYYGEKWLDEYDKFIIDINKSKFDCNKYLYLVCENDYIDLKNTTVIALFTYFFMYIDGFGDYDKKDNFAACYFVMNKQIENNLQKIKKSNFINILKKPLTSDIVTHYSIDDIDLMDGTEFENFISLLFSKMGYNSEVTKHSGDQGIDVIAEKSNNRIGIQTKCYSNSVGNSAIQEVVAGKSYYNCDKVIVITNNYFTNAAADLAHANNVLLWDRNILIEKVKQYF